MKFDFFFIPGLGMNTNEVSLAPSSCGLQNPGFASRESEIFTEEYTLEDVANYHLASILNSYDPEKPLVLSGMSLGGMILSIIASKYRDQLPPQTQFIFYVTSANGKLLPLIDRETLEGWSKARPGSITDFSKILKPFFSPGYIAENSEAFERYVEYRANGKSGQSSKSYFLQLNALLKFDGERHFSSLEAESSVFVYGEEDSLVNSGQMNRLKSLAPKARHIVIEKMGHMINLERPEIIQMKGALDDTQKISL